LSNVVKFQPPPKREEEPKEKSPQDKAVRFLWVSAVAGPLGSALLLVILFGFSDIGRALSNPTVSGNWVQLARGLGFAMVVGVAALPFSLVALGTYARAVSKGQALLRSTFIRRAVIAGGLYGFAVVAILMVLLSQSISSVGVWQILFSLVLSVIAGTAVSFVWAQVIWMLASPTAKRG